MTSPNGVAVPNTRELGVGDVFELFYRRVDGTGFNRKDAELGIEQWGTPGSVSVEGIQPVRGGEAGYNVRVVVREPGRASELFTSGFVTGRPGEVGYGDFALESRMKVGHIAAPLVEFGRAWDEATGWLTSGRAAEGIKNTVNDVARSVGEAVGSGVKGTATGAGAVGTGLLVLGGLAVGAYLLGFRFGGGR